MSSRKPKLPTLRSGAEEVYALKALQSAYTTLQTALGELSRSIKERPLACAFCGKERREVKVLVAGPAVFICDECIVTAGEVVAAELAKGGEP